MALRVGWKLNLVCFVKTLEQGLLSSSGRCSVALRLGKTAGRRCIVDITKGGIQMSSKERKSRCLMVMSFVQFRVLYEYKDTILNHRYLQFGLKSHYVSNNTSNVADTASR